MNKTIQYDSLDERNIIIDENKNLLLIEEKNITEGNFLIFSDIKPLEVQLQDLNNTANLVLLTQQGVI